MEVSEELASAFSIEGGQIPAVGFGTFQGGAGNDKVREAVSEALRIGYRMIDTAAAYGNERDVGEAIIESKIPREELFITTKLGQTWHDPSDVAEALRQSLENLQLGYVPHAYKSGAEHSTVRHPDGKPDIDLELSRDYCETWKAMEKLVTAGKTRMIGLSNFNVLKTKKILGIAQIRPAVNQVELHPYLSQTELLNFCCEQGIHLMAHQPLGGRPVAVVNPNAGRAGPLDDEDISRIASTSGKTPAQVMLSWAVQRGTSVIPKTVRKERMAQNLSLFKLSPAHMTEIDQLAEAKGSVRFLDPRYYIGFNIFDEVDDQPV